MLARNVSVLMASQVVTWALSLVAAVAIPRYLGAELIGQFHLANSVWALGFVVTAFGMNLALTKAVARDPSMIGSLLVTSVAARLLLCIPVSIALFSYAIIAGYSNQLLWVLVIVGLGTVVLTVSASVSAILQGLDRMGAMSIANIVGRLVFVGGALGLMILGYGIYAVAIVSGVGSVLALAIQLRALLRVRQEFGEQSPLSVDADGIRALLRESAPYFWITFFISLYLQVDTIVISLVVENDEVLGWYSVYDRLGGTLLFVPTVFMTAVYPTLARMYDSSRDDQRDANRSPSEHNRLTQKTFELMLLISIPIGLGLAVIARPLIDLMFGSDFTNAAPVVAVGGFVTSLTYLTTVLGMFLISMDRQRQWTRFIALGAVLTIPLDLVLVPFFQSRYDNGAIGGAVAYVITESIILAGAIYLLPRGALGPSSVFYVVRVLIAGLAMVLAVYPFRENYLLVPVLVGAVSYVAAVAVLRLVAPEDRQLLLARVPSTFRVQGRS